VVVYHDTINPVGNCPISHYHGTQHLEADAVIQQPTTMKKTNTDNKQRQRQSMKTKHTTNNATINLTTVGLLRAITREQSVLYIYGTTVLYSQPVLS
jgi:hypothetical protein